MAIPVVKSFCGACLILAVTTSPALAALSKLTTYGRGDSREAALEAAQKNLIEQCNFMFGSLLGEPEITDISSDPYGPFLLEVVQDCTH